MRWSRLQKLIYNLWAPDLDLKILCSAYRRSEGPDIGRYWITLDGEIIWQVPADLEVALRTPGPNPVASEVTAVLRQYIDAPKEALAEVRFEGDLWGLSDLLRVADRRIGKRTLQAIKKDSRPLHPGASKILEARLAARSES